MKKIQLPIPSSPEDTIHPGKPDLKWFFWMVGILLAIFVAVYVGGLLVSRVVLAKIDIPTEREMFGHLMLDGSEQPYEGSGLVHSPAGLFDEYPVYVTPSHEVNAYATIGANILITEGLLETIDTEEELLFILAHERAHIDNRDVLRSFIEIVPIQMTLQSMGIDMGGIDMGKIAGNYMSRENEKRADEDAINWMNTQGLNVDCVESFFTKNGVVFEKYLQPFSTHPSSEDRVAYLQSKNQHPEQPCTPFEWTGQE